MCKKIDKNDWRKMDHEKGSHYYVISASSYPEVVDILDRSKFAHLENRNMLVFEQPFENGLVFRERIPGDRETGVTEAGFISWVKETMNQIKRQASQYAKDILLTYGAENARIITTTLACILNSYYMDVKQQEAV